MVRGSTMLSCGVPTSEPGTIGYDVDGVQPVVVAPRLAPCGVRDPLAGIVEQQVHHFDPKALVLPALNCLLEATCLFGASGSPILRRDHEDRINPVCAVAVMQLCDAEVRRLLAAGRVAVI